MTYFILKIALSNMNRPMSSQELVAILTLTDIKGSFSTSTHYLQRGSPKIAYCMVIFNKYTPHTHRNRVSHYSSGQS